ncbi:hypothetical protein BKA70DRAFT_1415923 [Coprinopsis sp. MPI-PUGE-AT-0042]|nr:hypothetical protein BKA70DRAFT_1415923 [Coprinopsis sp. MPI-PUGE-AT-0042]
MLSSRIISIAFMFVLSLLIATASAAPTGNSPSAPREAVHLLSNHDLASAPEVDVAALEGAAAASPSLVDLLAMQEEAHKFQRAAHHSESVVQKSSSVFRRFSEIVRIFLEPASAGVQSTAHTKRRRVRRHPRNVDTLLFLRCNF